MFPEHFLAFTLDFHQHQSANVLFVYTVAHLINMMDTMVIIASTVYALYVTNVFTNTLNLH